MLSKMAVCPTTNTRPLAATSSPALTTAWWTPSVRDVSSLRSSSESQGSSESWVSMSTIIMVWEAEVTWRPFRWPSNV